MCVWGSILTTGKVGKMPWSCTYTHLTVKTCCLDPESHFENSDPLDPHQNPVDPYDWIPRVKIQT